MAPAAILLYFLATARALSATTNCLGWRIVASVAVLFFSWMAAAVISLALLPGVIGLLRVMWATR
jgi:hypothetical protein